MPMLYFVVPRKSKNQLKNKNNQLDAKPISTGKGKRISEIENYIHRQISQPIITYLFNQLKNRFLFLSFFLGTMELLSKYQYIKFIVNWLCF